MAMCDLGKSRDIIDDIFGVRNAFDKDRFGLLVDGRYERFWAGVCHPLDANSELLESNFELVISL